MGSQHSQGRHGDHRLSVIRRILEVSRGSHLQDARLGEGGVNTSTRLQASMDAAESVLAARLYSLA